MKNRIIGISLLLLLGNGYTIATPVEKGVARNKIDRQLSEANKSLQKGWVMKAIEAFQMVLRANPTNLEARLGLATAEEKQGLLDRAVKSYEAVVELDPNQTTALARLGILYSHKKETWPKAISNLKKRLELEEDLELKKLLGDLHMWSGEFAEAEKVYRQFLQYDSTVFTNLAEVLTWQQKGVEALPIFQQLRANNVDFDETARYAEALAYFQAERFFEAEERYLSLTRDFTKIEYRKDLEAIRKEITLLPERNAFKIAEKARLEFKNGNTKSAFASFEEALLLFDSMKLRLEYADLLSSVPEEREEALRQLSLIDPQNQEVLERKARILASITERRAEALGLYLTLYKTSPDNDSFKERIVELLSWQELDQERAVLAEIFLSSNDKLYPPLIRYYLRNNQNLKAIELLEQFLITGLNQSLELESRLQLARAYKNTNRLDKAKQEFDKILLLDPDNREAYEELGWYLLAEGKPVMALKSFDKAVSESAKVGKVNALLALDRPIAAKQLFVTIVQSEDQSTLNSRIEMGLSKVLGDNRARFGISYNFRSGPESVRTIDGRENESSSLRTIRYESSVAIKLNTNFGLFTKAARLNLDGKALGEANGFEGSIGLNYAPNDQVRFTGELGASIGANTTFLNRLYITPNRRVNFFFEAFRQPVTESFIAYNGVRGIDNTQIGQVLSNGGGFGVKLELMKATEVRFEVLVSNLTASNLTNNFRQQYSFNLGKEISNQKRFTYFRPSIQVTALSFSKDLNTIAFTSKEGIKTLARGYFSPDSFTSAGTRLDFAIEKDALQIKTGIGLAALVSNGSKSRFFSSSTTFGIDVNTNINYQINKRYLFDLAYTFTNSGVVFRENRLAFNFAIKLGQDK
ncbi:MAG: tetratricopeptide repeat protein [Blastocatellia bacterium]|nr:tetratricopeptide repeat protein [Blastocatellia bacterium]